MIRFPAAFDDAPALARVSVGVTSTPANGTYYVTGETITMRLIIPRLSIGNVGTVRIRLNIGGATREAASGVTASGFAQVTNPGPPVV